MGDGALPPINAYVAPHAGAWIETFVVLSRNIPIRVAPHAGAWIEMTEISRSTLCHSGRVPHAGAWIEI